MAINAHRVSAGEALRVLRAGWSAQCKGELTASWMLHGRPGVGKTELVQQLASDIGAELYDLRLTTIEPQDLRGLPFYDHENQKTIWFPPEDLPDTSEPAILFLDELTAASPQLQPTVYGLLQERRIGRRTLPAFVLIVAAGNSVEDGAVAYEMGTALSDRLVHIIVQADPDDWLTNYAPRAGIHPTVAAFLRSRPDLLDTTEASLRRGDAIACTPRSWSRVSAILSSQTDRDARNIMIAGTIGAAAAAELALVIDDIASSVQVHAMLRAERAKRSDLYPENLHGLTALMFALASATTKESLPAAIEILTDLPSIDRPGLPLSELASFGFEILISRAMDEGWQQVFASSPAYAAYAESRRQAGVS